MDWFMRENPIKMDDLGLPVMEPPPIFSMVKLTEPPASPAVVAMGKVQHGHPQTEASATATLLSVAFDELKNSPTCPR